MSPACHPYPSLLRLPLTYILCLPLNSLHSRSNRKSIHRLSQTTNIDQSGRIKSSSSNGHVRLPNRYSTTRGCRFNQQSSLKQWQCRQKSKRQSKQSDVNRMLDYHCYRCPAGWTSEKASRGGKVGCVNKGGRYCNCRTLRNNMAHARSAEVEPSVLKAIIVSRERYRKRNME